MGGWFPAEGADLGFSPGKRTFLGRAPRRTLGAAPSNDEKDGSLLGTLLGCRDPSRDRIRGPTDDIDDNTGEGSGDKRHNVITTRDDSDDVTMQWHGNMTTIAT